MFDLGLRWQYVSRFVMVQRITADRLFCSLKMSRGGVQAAGKSILQSSPDFMAAWRRMAGADIIRLHENAMIFVRPVGITRPHGHTAGIVRTGG